MRSYLAPVYATYFVAVIGLCVWLARTLFQNGAVFLKDVFPDRPDLGEAINRLLVTGFAMLNLGYGFFLLQGGTATDSTEAIEVLARKLGILLVSLAVVHFVNLLVFHSIANRRRQADLVPPVAPQRWVDGFEPPHLTPQASTMAPPPPPPARRPAAAPAPATARARAAQPAGPDGPDFGPAPGWLA